MKKIIGFLVVFGLLLVGCGNNSQEDTAKKFVTAVSDSEFEQAFTLLSTSGKAKLHDDIRYCKSVAKEDITEISYNFAVIMGMKAKYNASEDERKYYNFLSTETRAIFEKVKNTPKETIDKIKLKFTKKLIAEYGTKDKIPLHAKEKMTLDSFEALVQPYQSNIDAMYEQIVAFNKIPKERIKYPNIIKKLMGILGITFKGRKFAMHSPIANAIVNNVLNSMNIVDKGCMKRRTGISEVTAMKVIEVQEKSEDKATVRLELSYKKAEAKKVVIKLETFNDMWKVTSYFKER